MLNMPKFLRFNIILYDFIMNMRINILHIFYPILRYGIYPDSSKILELKI